MAAVNMSARVESTSAPTDRQATAASSPSERTGAPTAPADSPAAPVTPVARLSVIVPVYNERNTLRELLDRVDAQHLTWNGHPIEREVIVVDDCSNDGGVDFLEQAENRQRYGEVRLVRHPVNRGKGAAIRTGLQHATGTIVLIQDADLEYDPGEYANLLAPILEGRSRVVYGSRFAGHGALSPLPGMHPANWLANKLLSLTASVLFARRVTDEATCYKVLERDLANELDLRAERFDICPEMTCKVLRAGHTIVEVPITYRGRGTNEGKKIRWTDAFHAWWTLVRYRFFN